MKVCPSCSYLLATADITMLTMLGVVNRLTEIFCRKCNDLYVLVDGSQIIYFSLIYLDESNPKVKWSINGDQSQNYLRIYKLSPEDFGGQIILATNFIPISVNDFYQEERFLIKRLLKLKAFS
jgi:hypothetical protein